MTQDTKHMLTLDLESIKNVSDLNNALNTIEKLVANLKNIANESKRNPNVCYVINVLHGNQVETVSFDDANMYEEDDYILQCILKLNIPEVPAELNNIECDEGDIGYIIDTHLSENQPVYEILGSTIRCSAKAKNGASDVRFYLTNATRLIITRLPVSDVQRVHAGFTEIQDIRKKYASLRHFIHNDDSTFTFQV